MECDGGSVLERVGARLSSPPVPARENAGRDDPTLSLSRSDIVVG